MMQLQREKSEAESGVRELCPDTLVHAGSRTKQIHQEGFDVANAFVFHLSAFSSGGSGFTCQPSNPLIPRRNARARRAFSRIKLMINDVLIGVCSPTEPRC